MVLTCIQVHGSPLTFQSRNARAACLTKSMCACANVLQVPLAYLGMSMDHLKLVQTCHRPPFIMNGCPYFAIIDLADVEHQTCQGKLTQLVAWNRYRSRVAVLDIMGCLTVLAVLVLSVAVSVQAQNLTIANYDPCAAQLGQASPSDNLSCEFSTTGLRCYPRSQLCNGVNFCVTGSDEGDNIAALDCKLKAHS